MTSSSPPPTGAAPSASRRLRAPSPIHHTDPVADDENPPSRIGPPAAALFPLVALTIAAATVWLDARVPPTEIGLLIAGDAGWPYAVNGLVVSVFAAIILARRSRPGFAVALGGLGLFWALDGLAQSYVRVGLEADGAWPAMSLALWFLNRFGAFLPAAIALILLVFPTGRFLPGRPRAISWAAAILMLLSGAVYLVVPAPPLPDGIVLPPGVVLDPIPGAVLAPLRDAMAAAAAAGSIVGFLVTLALVVHRYRLSSGLMRDRMRWLLWATVMMVAVVVSSILLPVPDVLITVIGVLPAAAMTIAVVHPRIVAIRSLLADTIVVAAVLGVLVAAHAVVLSGLALVLGDQLTRAQVVAVVLIVTVLLYGPLRARLSNWVRRRMLGDRADPYDALTRLSSALESTDDPAEQLAAVARSVAHAFGIRYAGVELAWGGGDSTVSTYGTRPAAVHTIPVTYRGAQVGRLLLPARGVRGRLSARDEQLLGDLVRQAAIAARTAQLAGEVQRSRERLVSAREEERRRIRRDLHDGLGPALSGVVFQLEAARMAVRADPDAAERQLATVTEHVQGIVGDVRRLVHDLRPPALDDRGLVGAVQQVADRLDVPLAITAPDLTGRLPAAVEVAAYRIASESLMNIARHARATAARLTLELAGDVLAIEIADDGIGIPAERQAGVGLVSLRERAVELGGTADIICPPDGGTIVRARLPLGDPHA